MYFFNGRYLEYGTLDTYHTPTIYHPPPPPHLTPAISLTGDHWSVWSAVSGWEVDEGRGGRVSPGCLSGR